MRINSQNESELILKLYNHHKTSYLKNFSHPFIKIDKFYIFDCFSYNFRKEYIPALINSSYKFLLQTEKLALQNEMNDISKNYIKFLNKNLSYYTQQPYLHKTQFVQVLASIILKNYSFTLNSKVLYKKLVTANSPLYQNYRIYNRDIQMGTALSSSFTTINLINLIKNLLFAHPYNCIHTFCLLFIDPR